MSKESPLISLCLIAGNESMHVRRCLKIFAPCADEIIVVRAIGSLEPDDTLDIARTEFGAVTAEYKNGPGHESWPHVDSFSNARNMAFDLARGQFQFWVDFDDIADPDHVNGIRNAAEDCAAGKYNWDILHFGYVIPYSGACPMRERLIRRGCGRWKDAVHESFSDVKPGIIQAINDQILITHAPMTNKVKQGISSRRNLTILEGIENKTHGEAFFYFMELCGAGRIGEAVEAAKKALAYPELAPQEKYEVYMNLSSASEGTEKRRAFLHECVRLSPERREAWALLCAEATNWHEPETSMAYARIMRSLPRPAVRGYTHRDNVYGWGGDMLYAGALRLNGKFEEAEAMETANFIRAGGLISLLHATRGRPNPAALARKYWFDTAGDPGNIEHIFAIDEDDAESLNALGTFRHVRVKAGGGCVAAWNAAAAASKGQVLIQLSDDWIPPICWDRELLARIGDTALPKVLAISDGHRKDHLLCMAILTRARYHCQIVVEASLKVGRSTIARGTPYLFHPDFKSMYSDNYFTHQAYKDGVVIEARDLIIEHNNPMLTGDAAKWDKTYAESNTPERYAEGKAIYERLTGEKLP